MLFAFLTPIFKQITVMLAVLFGAMTCLTLLLSEAMIAAGTIIIAIDVLGKKKQKNRTLNFDRILSIVFPL